MSQDSNNKDINGKEQPIYRSSLDGRSIEHVEMDYNLSLIGKTIQGYTIMGSGSEGSLDLTDDLDKVLKLHKIIAADTELIANGGKVNEYVWIVVDSSNGGGVNSSLIPDTDAVYDLGSPFKRFRDLYLTNNTIYLGEDSVSTFEGKIQVNNIPLIDESDFLAEIDERARLLGVETELRTVAVSSLNNKLTAINDETSAVAQSVLDLNTAFTADLTNAITGEQLARTEAISGINETLTSLSTGDGAIAESITALDTKFTTELNDAITGETTARTEAIGTINQTLTALSDADGASAEARTALDTKFTNELNDAITGETTARTEAVADINQTLTALSDADGASAEARTALSTSFSTEIAGAVSTETSAREQAILSEVEARTSEIKALADSVPSAFDSTGLTTTLELETEASTRVSQIAAEAAERARLLGIETLARTTSDSAINETLTTLNTANLATAQSVTDLNAEFTQELTDKVSGETLLRTAAIAGVNDSITALTDKDKAIVLSVTNLGTKFTADIDAAITGESNIRTEAITDVTSQIVAVSDANGANVTRVDTLEAQYTITDGSITGLSPTSATKTTIDSAIATEKAASVSSTTALIAAAEGRVAGVTEKQSAEINALTGKVDAQYTLEVNADGNVAGMKLGADENGSSISFAADTFKISSGIGLNSERLTPFSIIDGKVAFNGAVSFTAGPQGPTGTTGTSSYLHVAYTNKVGSGSGAGTGFSTTDSYDKLYMGTFTSTNEYPSEIGDDTKYDWVKIKGEDGVNGTGTWTPVITPALSIKQSGSGEFIKKADSGWGASVHSAEGHTGGVYMSTKVNRTDSDLMFGLNSDPLTDDNYPSIDYAFYARSGGLLEIYESGTRIVPPSQAQTFTTSTVLSIVYDGTSIKYSRDGAVIRSIERSITAPLYLDTSIHTTLSGINSLIFGKSGVNGLQGVQGAKGSKGSAGSNYRAVNLVATSYVVPYKHTGERWWINDINVKAKALNTVGTVYYTFLLNDEVVQGPSTEIIYTYTPPTTYDKMPDTIEVEIREGSGTSAILARDQITMSGTQSSKDGVDGITVVLSNEAHSLPTTKDGVVNYDGSGTGIYVYEGVNQLEYDGSGIDEKTWKITSVTSNITRGDLTDNGKYVTVGKHKDMDANTASITYTISGRRTDNTLFEFTKVQTFAKSIEGQTGAQGDKGLKGAQGTDGPGGAHARAVNLTSGKQVFFYNTAGTTPSPATTVITATPVNTTGTPYYRFYLNDEQVSAGQLPTYTYTPNTSFLNMPDKIEVEMREGNNTLSTPILARDQITMSAIKNVINGTNGVNGITVILSNEAHTLPVTSAGVVDYAGSGTKISVYEGATELAYNGSGTSNSTWKITHAQANITRSTSLTDNGKSLTVGNHTGMNADTATITYTISGKRANGVGFTFTKVQTFAKSHTGATGDKGAQGTKGDKGTDGVTPSTSQFLTQSTIINGATIETGILKNGNFGLPGYEGSGAGAGDLAAAPWNTYSTGGMGINLDKGAISAENFYIDQLGNAKFRGDMDIEGNATIGGELASNLFAVDPESTDDKGVVIPRRLKFKPDVYFGNTQFDIFTNDFSTIAGDYADRFNDFVDYDPDGNNYRNEEITRGVTLSHNYIKRNDTQIEVGDLVKLNENNELVRASSAQDNTIVGILWHDIDFTIKESPLDKFLPNGKDTSEKPHHYKDSLGNKIPVVDRDIKTLWRVAAIGDSREGTLTGMKVCDQNGLILTGDLVCSSDTPGYVMKQPVDYVIVGFENEVPIYEERQTINSFTVGKCMEDCAFDTEGKAEGIYGYLYCG